MSAERLREMLSEVTPRWRARTRYPECLSVGERHVFHTRMRSVADAQIAVLAPDAIALLADFAQKVSEVIDHRDLECEGDCVTNRKDLLRAFLPLIERFDALCGDER